MRVCVGGGSCPCHGSNRLTACNRLLCGAGNINTNTNTNTNTVTDTVTDTVTNTNTNTNTVANTNTNAPCLHALFAPGAANAKSGAQPCGSWAPSTWTTNPCCSCLPNRQGAASRVYAHLIPSSHTNLQHPNILISMPLPLVGRQLKNEHEHEHEYRYTPRQNL